MLRIPTRTDVTRRLQAYASANVTGLDPTVTRRRGFIGAFLRSIASAMHDWYVALKRYGDNEPFPQRASEAFFARGWWIDITNLPRRSAAPAQGRIIITGTAGSVIPTGTLLVARSGIEYATDFGVTVIAQSLRGTMTTPDPTLARFVTPRPHLLATGMTLTVSGAPWSVMDGAQTIRVVDETTIEFDLTTSISGPPDQSQTILSGAWANVTVTATVAGEAGNLDDSATLDFKSTPSGVTTTARLAFGGIADGVDIERFEEWRARVIQGLGTDFGTFSATEIEIVAKTVPGVTRVFVRRPVRVPTEGFPLEGQVRIAFLRDHDDDPIPSALEVQQVRDAIHSAILPAHTYPDDVEVLAPLRYPVDVRFHYIKPDTPAMREAVRASVLQYLFEEATWGGTLSMEGLRCAIRAAFDTETGQRLISYSLATPTTDIILPIDGYPVLTSIAWSV